MKIWYICGALGSQICPDGGWFYVWLGFNIAAGGFIAYGIPSTNQDCQPAGEYPAVCQGDQVLDPGTCTVSLA
jgi:hypothetical protein